MKKSFLPRTSTRLSAGSMAARASAASCCSRPWASTSTRIPSSPATCPTLLTGSRTENSTAPDPWQVYPGDPHDHTGYGCYSPCIVKALNSALEHEGAADKFEVVDESGKTAAELCSYIDAGMPVVFWATLDFQPVPEKRDHWLLADGTDFAWKCNEHCLLLVGYDDENYWFNDPWHDHGVCPQPKQLVEDCHAAQGLFAVTLRPKGEA